MVNLTYSEAYVHSFISISKKDLKLGALSHILLGLYVCDFLDTIETEDHQNFQKRVNEYFLNPSHIWGQGSLLFPILEKLRQSNLLEIKKEKIFNCFSLIHFKTKKNKLYLFSTSIDDLNTFIFDALTKYKDVTDEKKLAKSIKTFNRNLFSIFKTHKNECSTYELRFFWPSTHAPEVYECIQGLFDEKYYRKESNKDKYITQGHDLILKLRKHQLYIKKCMQNFFNIRFFAKKRKIEIPSKGTFFENISDKNVIDIAKERYIRKIGSHSKIEFSLIKVQGKQWKTICIESTKIHHVLALSFLINQKHSEKLTYAEFLKKYANKTKP